MLGGRRCTTPDPILRGRWTPSTRKCAESVALSSSVPADDQLALPAAWLGFVLPALRARRKKDSTTWRPVVQGAAESESPQFAKVAVFHISTSCSQPGEKALDPAGGPRKAVVGEES